MGLGNVCVTGSYEGLFYIDNDDLRVYRKDGPGTDDCEDCLQRDLDYADITGPDWYLDEVGSSYEEADVLECFCNEMRKLCPSFQPAANSNVWLGNERRVILENELFYICVEDNEWSLARRACPERRLLRLSERMAGRPSETALSGIPR